VFWASLQIPIPKNPDDPVATMYDHLERFINQMLDADAHFSVFPHNLSEYESINDLPEPIEDPDQLPDEVNEWLEYFPRARPRACGGYTYTQVLLGFHKPFPKIVKATASWFHKMKFGLWKHPYNLKNQPHSDGSCSQQTQWTSKCYEAKSP